MTAPRNPLSGSHAWTSVADGYVDVTMPMLARFAEPAIERAALTPEQDVVDVATGPGTIACWVAPRVRSVQAIDFSPAMIAHCRARAARLGLENVTATVGDGQALPWPDGSFDVGFSMFGLMFFPDRAAGFRELHRVLRPGGRAFVTSWAPVSESPLMQTMIAACAAADPAPVQRQRNVETLEDPARFAGELTEAGFVDVEVERVFRDVEYRSLDELCDGFFRGSAPMTLLREQVGEAEWQRRTVVMREHLAAAVPSYPCRLGSTAWLGSGRKAG